MSNTNQNLYPDDTEPTGPVDESGLVGEANSPDNTGLVGSPDSLDNSGLEGSGQIDIAGTPGSGTDTTGAYGSGADTDMSGAGTVGAGTVGAGTGRADYSGANSAELPDQQLLQPGYNPQIGDAGRLQDLEREGPNPTGYGSDADQTRFANRDDENAPAGPDADMRSNETDQQTGY